ncbi:hypothetical protein [Streptomyces albipurpureus]|uniref:Uncharacterized protein n=1 Tax=Streptomyces albipurpureus TaxID=2897419 RepID=A0ABT0UNH5_9ACTN|nr:hypothetical protein [Streptomyces sp. CWNU-1]MCM2389882.1 hypothetical protein [Streptomyces sp. CWNU-1]
METIRSIPHPARPEQLGELDVPELLPGVQQEPLEQRARTRPSSSWVSQGGTSAMHPERAEEPRLILLPRSITLLGTALRYATTPRGYG